MFRLQPARTAAAAVVQFADINNGTLIEAYQSTMSLLVIDISYLDGWDGELVVKGLAVADSSSNMV